MKLKIEKEELVYSLLDELSDVSEPSYSSATKYVQDLEVAINTLNESGQRMKVIFNFFFS